MKQLILACLIIFASLPAMAQVSVSGRVVEASSGEPITGASVIFRNAEGKIKKFATSDVDGNFTLSVPSTAGCTLEVSMISFAKKSVGLAGVKFPLTISLESSSFELKEVAVKGQRIREQGDTITYSVGSFAQAQDRTIGDVLKRMPGINVEKSGKIQYQGEDINKFYIEGSDLLGGKYGIATNGISHDDVGAVEVMENHQPMQVLAGINFSDKAAINLKLKNKSKATWAVHGDAGGGYSCQPEGGVWDGSIFAMAVMPSFQNITTLKSNNTGTDLSTQSTDFFSKRRNTELSRYVDIALPTVPSLNAQRTLFNRSVLASTNTLQKLKNGEFKAQLDYGFNRVTASAANVTTYFLENGNRVITENRDGTERTHSLSGKFIYEVNKRTTFINNTLKTDIDWDEITLGMTGSIPNTQSASLPDYYVNNNFKMIKRFRQKHLVTFQSINEWESLPQTLNVDLAAGRPEQHIGNHAFFTHESAAYAFVLKGVTVSLEGGIKGYFRSLTSDLPELPDNDLIPGESVNAVNTNYLTVYATPRFEYWMDRVNFSLNAPVSFARYKFNKAIADRSEAYFSPSLSMTWKPNSRLSMSLHGSAGRSPMDLSLIHPGYIMTSYRSFTQGVDDFYTSSSQSISASVSYRKTSNGLFANAMASQRWSHLPYTLSQQLFGDYIVYSYSTAKNDSRSLMAMGSVGKTLDFMRGSISINGSFSRRESQLISMADGEAQAPGSAFVESVSTGWQAGASISGAPTKWLSFDYALRFSSNRLTMNEINASWLTAMTNRMLINIMPHKKWEWHIIGDHYRNELTADNFKSILLLDTKLIYKLNRRIEFSASLTNICNKRSYNYTTYNQLSSFESQRNLRGRELLFSLFLKK
ncbi:carboxypeptidase regulatory-like domain-containing protein [uncultured Duncaniella sp.]|uniref:carboxypeptidase regulatory-like domain-containing protein n=1 Tax=uncultured Duncaniella sp. TaxID=2768039 RepID=UPI0025F6FDAA|nr:carboxypeptidase regulatory-like domain-containing protein [uncultured Duncaniella sp.]